MPEMPELERERKKMNQMFVGQRIRNIELLKESWSNTTMEQLHLGLIGRQLLYVERRAKGLIFHLDDGRRLLLTVGHGAHFITSNTDGGNETNEVMEEESLAVAQLQIDFDSSNWRVVGARTLAIQWLSAKETDDITKEWGIEPLGRHLNATLFQNRFAKRRTALRTALSNQALIAGISPAMADEICYRAAILPTAKTETLTSEDWEAVFNAMVEWLQEAIETPDSTNFAVSGRQGKACAHCKTTLTETLINGKISVYCTSCQHEHVPVAVGTHG